MSLSIGIVGLPNVGKSTLFNALTEKKVEAANYPFCTIDPSVGVVPVPDERLDKLSDFSGSAKKIPAVVEFVDIAGLVEGAHKGEGLGNKFLQNIREVDAIAEVVRIFDDGDITHVSGKVDPMDDIETINLELIMADFQTVSKRIGNLSKEVKRGDKEAIAENNLLVKLEKVLDDGKLASSVKLDDNEGEIVKSLHLLTMKPILYILNKKSGGNNLDETGDERYKELVSFLENSGSNYVVVDAKIEQELSEFDGEEKDVFREELGAQDDGINNLIKESYEMLNLITFFTTGPEETRAWTIIKDSTAPEAGAAIHTDFRDKFIRADVISSEELLGIGSVASAREKGSIRTEGKDYIVKDGDVVVFRV